MVKLGFKREITKMDKVAPESIEIHPSQMNNMDLGGGDFSSLTLSDISPTKKVKTPRKILHFSDGTLEEYSTDEEDMEDKLDAATARSDVDLKSLSWVPWMGHIAKSTGSSVLSACDYVGESVANVLGITSQKYFYEIEDYKRSLKEQEEEKKEEEAQMSGWTSNHAALNHMDTDFNVGNDFSGEPIIFTSKVQPVKNEQDEKY